MIGTKLETKKIWNFKPFLRAVLEDVDGGGVDGREPLDGLVHRPRTRRAGHPGHGEHRHLVVLLIRSSPAPTAASRCPRDGDEGGSMDMVPPI